MATITIPVTNTESFITNTINPITIALVLALIALPYIYHLKKKEGTRAALIVIILPSSVLIPIIGITYIISLQTSPPVSATTKSIQEVAKDHNYTFYEKDHGNKLQTPTNEKIKLPKTDPLYLLENTTGELCTAEFKSEIYDTETLEPKQYTYSITCEESEPH